MSEMPVVPANLRKAINEVVLAANDEGYVISGIVFHASGSIIMMNNTTDDPAKLMHAAADLVQTRIDKGLIVSERIQRQN